MRDVLAEAYRKVRGELPRGDAAGEDRLHNVIVRVLSLQQKAEGAPVPIRAPVAYLRQALRLHTISAAQAPAWRSWPEDLDEEEDVASWRAGPAEDSHAEQLVYVKQVISRANLPEAHLKALALDFEDYSDQEIAEALSAGGAEADARPLTRDAVVRRFQRTIRPRLRAVLEEGGVATAA